MLFTHVRSGLRLVVTTSVLLGLSSQVLADGKGPDRCLELEGPFSSTTVEGPLCPSPVGLCTHGILAGPLRDASYDFIVETFEPDPEDPTRVIATGVSVVTTKQGQMFTDDVSILQFTGPDPSDPVLFETTATITSGTQRWKHTTGEFVATGTLNFVTGEAIGSYTASLCRSRGKPGGSPGDRECN